jgi:hypothetical protein
VTLVVAHGIARFDLHGGLQVTAAEKTRCVALSAAEGNVGLIHDGSYGAIETQFLYNIAPALLSLVSFSSRLNQPHLLSYHLIPCHVESSCKTPPYHRIITFNPHDNHVALVSK